jgi:phage shock protein A
MKGTAASMSVMKRVSLIFRAKADKALDRMEDPRETLTTRTSSRSRC